MGGVAGKHHPSTSGKQLQNGHVIMYMFYLKGPDEATDQGLRLVDLLDVF